MLINQKKITTVVSDFDGTIIKEGMIVPPPEFFQVVERLLSKGYTFVAASGRQYANLKRILAPVADRIHFIAENGCLVVYQNQVIYKKAFPRELAFELLQDMLIYEGTEIMISGENTSYTVPRNKEFAAFLREAVKNNVTILEDYEEIKEDIIKMSIFWKTGIPEEEKRIFHEKYDGRLQVANGGNGWLDFNMLGTGKGEALVFLAEHMGISTEETVAFGDNENDISMLQKAGVSYCVESAREHVKRHSDFICDSVEDILNGFLDEEERNQTEIRMESKQ